ncbi:SRPBCC family protein [Flavobacterium sp. '19STA2R22 D10 B1']|uniref:SRPBCC family protein n=1 Tax=Flavobacterium aerium TaxID=3037261 RepID=UPI00278BB129|nr:SRPBCC family protein [Flavobacterium sp. '19STA2R22 D10 B1']
METKTNVTVEAKINAPVEKVWQLWNDPKHIVKWTTASDDWHTPKAENDLKVGGAFLTRMEAKDGSFGFDFEGVYDVVDTHKSIEYTMSDGRKVKILFKTQEGVTEIVETFDAEQMNPVEMQREGWQSILNNFKKHVENN